MTGITQKKVIGSLAIAFVVAVGAFGSAKAAQAFFLASGASMIFDATVGSTSSNSLTVYTTSTTPITVDVNSHTLIQGATGLSNLGPGDEVKIIASRVDGVLTAQIVKVETNISGYGTAGDMVLVSPAVVVSTGANSFVVKSNGVDITFNVDSESKFFNTSLSQLTAGQKLVVIGQDTGDSSVGFYAQDIFN
jgi:hypothetical protein